MDRNTYLGLWKCFFDTPNLNSVIKDWYLVNLESHYAMVLTTVKGKKIGVKMLPTRFNGATTPLETLFLQGGHKLELVEAKDILIAWKNINLPETNVPMFDDYTEFEMFNSLFNKRMVSVGDKPYRIIDLLGCGKEARVFKVTDINNEGILALKSGIFPLEQEVEYMTSIQGRLTRCGVTNLFPHYLAFDKNKNMIIMEYVHGQTLDDFIAHEIITGGSLEKLLLCYGNVAETICGLKEDYGILYGQFNLKNIIVEPNGSIRFLDPLYSLPPEKYPLLQIIRIGAILMETFYGLRDSTLPEKTKSAATLEDLANLNVADSVLRELEEIHLPTKSLVDYKVKSIVRKCLVPKSRLKRLSELRDEFEELKSLVYSYYPELNKEGQRKVNPAMQQMFKTYTERKYRVIALDFNNTISLSEETDKYALGKISSLLQSGVHVAIISGRRAVWTDHFMRELGLFMQNGSTDVLRHLHFYNSEGGIGRNIGTGEIYYEKIFDPLLMENVKRIIQRKFPQINFQTQFRTDGYRLNFDTIINIDELNELFRKNDLLVNAMTSGTSIDVVPHNVNKGVALNDLASRLGISTDDIGKIADQGRKEGNDNSLLVGFGAFSVDNYELNSTQVSTFEILRLRKVIATSWLLDNLKFVGENGTEL